MKSISNKTHRPIRVPLSGGKFLYLGPGKTGQIADTAAERPAVKKMIEAGDIEIRDAGVGHASGEEQGAAGHAATHGHAPNTLLRPKGDR